MIYLFIIFLESICMLLWLHIGFRRKLKVDRNIVLFAIVYEVYYYVVTIMGFDTKADIISFFLILIWTKLYFGERIFKTIVGFVVCVVGLSLCQIVFLKILHLLEKQFMNIGLNEIYIATNLLCLLFSFLLYKLLVPKLSYLSIPNKYSLIIWLCIIGIVMFIKYDYEKYNGAYGFMYTILLALLVILVYVIIKGLETNNKLNQQKLELELRQEYEETYKSLLEEMRRKQHDYKNQITALYSIQTINDNDNIIWELQREYGDILLKTDKIDDLLVKCDSSVLSGYIYAKCSEAERLGIEVVPHISFSEKYNTVASHKIIELLGIMINNAIEYLMDSNWEQKIIEIYVYEKLEKLHIEVNNIAQHFSYMELENMFKKGYSTKGNDRGIGLHSLKIRVAENKGEIIVSNEIKDENNWLKIGVVI